jgi:hypothetical protein
MCFHSLNRSRCTYPSVTLLQFTYLCEFEKRQCLGCNGHCSAKWNGDPAFNGNRVELILGQFSELSIRQWTADDGWPDSGNLRPLTLVWMCQTSTFMDLLLCKIWTLVCFYLCFVTPYTLPLCQRNVVSPSYLLILNGCEMRRV